MPIPEKFLAQFNEHNIYHVYNRTNHKERLFLSNENYRFFLQKYNEYLSAYVGTFAWCLLPNHFHLIIRVKDSSIIRNYLSGVNSQELVTTEKAFLKNEISLNDLIVSAFKRFFQSYSLSFNVQYKRQGNLFYKPFKRVEINKEEHFTQAIIYTHANPVKHGITKDLASWRWSSYQSFLSNSSTQLLRDEVLEWFGSKKEFERIHLEMTDYYFDGLTIE
jgi:putative transposase